MKQVLQQALGKAAGHERIRPLKTLVVAGAALVAFATLTSLTAAAPVYTGWSAPVNLGPVVNSPVVPGSTGGDLGPALSRDGLSLYFYSLRPGGMGAADIYVSRRSTVSDAWGAPVNLGAPINTASADSVPSLSTDGHWMLFASDRAGGVGGADLYQSYRADIHDDFGWQAPTNLGPNVNTTAGESGNGYFENGGHPQLFFGSDRPGGLGAADLYVSEQQADGTWGPAAAIPELNSTAADNRPSVRQDGLEIFFYSARPGGVGANDLWVATRGSVDAPWSTPVSVGGPVDTGANEQHPNISADGKTLFFTSDRPGGSGGFDLWMTTREQVLPSTKDDCKDGGWERFGVFKNQGDCMSYLATGGTNEPS